MVKQIGRTYLVMYVTLTATLLCFISVLIFVRDKESLPRDDPNALPYSVGITLRGGEFLLNGERLWIIGGSLDYFSVTLKYWKDYMLRMKSVGINTLQTCVPWNLHEPMPGKFNFAENLNIREFITLAEECGLYVVIHLGPFSCQHQDLNGLPSWLLKDPNMKIRSNYKPYKDAVGRFLEKMASTVEDLQITRNGPVIAFQIENDYMSSPSAETQHLHFIANSLQYHGIRELLMTSGGVDNVFKIPHQVVLPTLNLKSYKHLHEMAGIIREKNPDFPVMVTEHDANIITPEDIQLLEEILRKRASIIFNNVHEYHCHGISSLTSSLSNMVSFCQGNNSVFTEVGYISKWHEALKSVILKHVPLMHGALHLPPPPPIRETEQYGTIGIKSQLQWRDILALTEMEERRSPVPMEMLNVRLGYGQAYGYVIYQKDIGKGKRLHIPSPVLDRAQVFVDDKEVATITSWQSSIQIDLQSATNKTHVEIMVENLGRGRNGTAPLSQERKGLTGDIYLDKAPVFDWKIYSLDFNKEFLHKLKKTLLWKGFTGTNHSPTIYRAELIISNTPKDTFINMKGWKKGVVIINGFNLGKYWNEGQVERSRFVPAPVLKRGINEVLIFEQQASAMRVSFESRAI